MLMVVREQRVGTRREERYRHAVRRGGQRLGERLVDAKVVSRTQICRALAIQETSSARLGTILVDAGAIDEQTLVSVLSAQLDLPIIDLRHGIVSPKAASAIPEALARELGALPIRKGPLGLDVAVSQVPDPDDWAAMEMAAGQPVHLYLAPSSQIRAGLDGLYRPVRPDPVRPAPVRPDPGRPDPGRPRPSLEPPR